MKDNEPDLISAHSSRVRRGRVFEDIGNLATSISGIVGEELTEGPEPFIVFAFSHSPHSPLITPVCSSRS
ncbi:hypothetical protein FocTR4_00001469 [Fusarium oxysporum f. sp. cubense]|nr:hypothetical protein FocTR4_00001469 [Fusarium oxysporum f. sp. cubense]